MENWFKTFCYLSNKTYVVGTYMDLLTETVLLKTKYTPFNLMIRETSQFLCYKRLLNLTYVAYKINFSTKCNSDRIGIQWFHIKRH